MTTMQARLIVGIDSEQPDHLEATLIVGSDTETQGGLSKLTEARGWAYTKLKDLGYTFRTGDWEVDPDVHGVLFRKVRWEPTSKRVKIGDLIDAINNTLYKDKAGFFGWGGKLVIDLENTQDGKVFHNENAIVTGARYGD